MSISTSAFGDAALLMLMATVPVSVTPGIPSSVTVPVPLMTPYAGSAESLVAENVAFWSRIPRAAGLICPLIRPGPTPTNSVPPPV